MSSNTIKYRSINAMLAPTHGPPLIVLIAASTYRSCCNGTLAQRVEQLDNALAPHMLAASEGRPPLVSALRGDEADLSKLLALKTVAARIKEQGSMLYSEAATLACARRDRFFKDAAAMFSEAQHLNEAPAWREKEAGHELLARLPLVRLPLSRFGSAGGSEQSLLIPILPGLNDAELLQNVSFVKELRCTRHASWQRGQAMPSSGRVLQAH